MKLTPAPCDAMTSVVHLAPLSPLPSVGAGLQRGEAPLRVTVGYGKGTTTTFPEGDVTVPQNIEVYLEWPGLDPEGPEFDVQVTQDMSVAFADAPPTRLIGIDGYLREALQREPTGPWRVLRGLVGPTIWATVQELVVAGENDEVEVEINADQFAPLFETWASIREIGESNILRPMPDPDVARQMAIAFADPARATRILDRMDQMFEELDRERGQN
jgi:hypothetical protein